jgi:hypothetical protein
MEFGLVTGFIGLIQTVTEINYCAVTNSHTLQFPTPHTKTLSPLCLH